MKIRRCRHVPVPGRRSWAFVPRCLGGAVNGPRACTCPTEDEVLTSFARGIIIACHYAVALTEAERIVSPPKKESKR